MPDSIGIGQENALRLLEQYGYIKTSFEHHGSDGFSYRIDLRGENFFAEPATQPDEPTMADSASMYRHLLKFQQDAAGEDHIAAVMCNAMMIIHTVEMVKRGVLPKELLDMPDYGIPRVHFNKDEPYDV